MSVNRGKDMNTYKMIVSYDGTDYHGWQVQNDAIKTVAGVLRSTFLQVFDMPVHLLGASRTDAGVHALGQVVRVQTPLSINQEKMLQAWDNALPPDIVIRSLAQESNDFNPLACVASKTYWYRFFIERPLPFVQRYGYWLRYSIDIKKLQKALAVFVGEHDFRSFATGDDMVGGTVRTINSIEITDDVQTGAHCIIFKGPGFLRYMIRRIAGACIEVASRDSLSIDDLRIALDQKNPYQPTLPTAPAKGLLLHSIKYKED